MTAGNATADYPSSALADRKQARMDSWKNGFTLKQRNAPKALAGVPEEGQNALLICCAILGHPKRALRRFNSTMTPTRSSEGPFGPGFAFLRDENNR
jgi:hypothetical protein